MNIDQVADMLTRIRNAQQARKSEVLMPSSKLKVALATLLNKYKYIGDVATFADGNKKYLKMQLRYVDNTPAIKGIKRISKLGQRIYMNKKELPIIKNGHGIAVISTSQGLMTNDKAREAGLGGEIICEVW